MIRTSRATLLLLVAAWAGGAVLAPAAAAAPRAQEPRSELSRLAQDQRKLAEQARRLERLLAELEQRERAAGNEAKAELLAGARERLRVTEDRADLAALLESIASDLSSMRAGPALESQAEVIRALQEILDYLLERELADRLQALREAIDARQRALEEMARAQAGLLDATRELEAAERQSGASDPAERERLAQQQRELSERVRELAEQQRSQGQNGGSAERAAEAGEEAAEAIAPDSEAGESRPRDEQAGATPPEGGERPEEQSGERLPEDPAGNPPPESGAEARPERAPNPPQAGEPGETTPPQAGEPSEPQPGQPGQATQLPRDRRRPQPGQDLDRAQEKQREALDELRRAAEQARRDAQELEDLERMEALLDVAAEAEALLERHRAVQEPLSELAARYELERPPRSTRVQLRRWAEEEKELAALTGNLATQVLEGGADSFPFMMHALREDHELLSGRLGPPLYRGDASAADLAERITVNWEQLIEAIRTEAERIRQRIEGDPQQGEGESPEGEQPLVSFAAELQLLKRLEEDLRDRVELLARRRALLDEAGIALDESDRLELERLVERQGRLRRLYEAMLERLRESQEGGATEEA